MKPRLSRELLEKARNLRRNPTQAEKILWKKIRNQQICGIKFRRQHPIGTFIVDFYSHQARLAISGSNTIDPLSKMLRQKALEVFGQI